MSAACGASRSCSSERARCMQVPVKEREKLLKKEGLDPTRLANLTLVYKVQEVSSAGFASLTSRLVKPCGATSVRPVHAH